MPGPRCGSQVASSGGQLTNRVWWACWMWRPTSTAVVTSRRPSRRRQVAACRSRRMAAGHTGTLGRGDGSKYRRPGRTSAFRHGSRGRFGGVPDLRSSHDMVSASLRRGFWRSPLRGPWFTVGARASSCSAGSRVLFVTGLLSYAAYNPDLSPVNDKTPDKGILGFYLFAWPTDPHWLYRLTQGVHVTLGITLIPVLLAKLWSVIPRLFTLPPARSARARAGADLAAAAGRRRAVRVRHRACSTSSWTTSSPGPSTPCTSTGRGCSSPRSSLTPCLKTPAVAAARLVGGPSIGPSDPRPRPIWSPHVPLRRPSPGVAPCGSSAAARCCCS